MEFYTELRQRLNVTLMYASLKEGTVWDFKKRITRMWYCAFFFKGVVISYEFVYVMQPAVFVCWFVLVLFLFFYFCLA